ncbi:MAG: bifunctional oligoribonuclease/PAP phosphatase NrnA [Termitinemataceae bacterium]|nr:MAG: bifunctional oligoribonuclease/PAP phosphatase NrnA [Termitinemataceae bacterium]
MSLAIVPQALLDFIKKHDKFLIVGHKEPDGDCIGCQLGLALGLRKIGKTVLCFSDGPFKRNEVLKYKPYFENKITESDRENAAAIIVDCSTRERTGDIGKSLDGIPLALIDHHASGDPEGDVVFVDSEAPAAVLLVFSLLCDLDVFGGESGNDGDDTEIAEVLFLGLATDTGYFRHLDTGSGDTFTLAAKLIDMGANPKKIYAQMNGGKSLNSRSLLGTVLSKIKPFFDGRLVITSEELEETTRFGLESRDSDTFYQLVQAVDEVQAIVVIRQESVENCTVGLRSRDSVDVGKIAAALGGGGHKNAAGFLKPGKIEDVKQLVLAEFKKVFAAD